MLGKKAQMTLFLLIGVLLVASVGFVLRATTVETKAKLDTETEKLTAELLKTTAFENYVSKCLKKLAKEAIIYVGQQGGKIDEVQGGTDNWLGDSFIPGKDAIPFTKENKTFYVFYGIKKQFLYENPQRRQIPAPPLYPYPGNIRDDIETKERSYGTRTYIYGANKLLPLCDIDGPNRRAAEVKNTCKTYGPGSYSVQRQIQDYIQKNLPLCVDFDTFASTFAYNVTQGDVSVNVTITDDFVSVGAEYPLDIRFKQEKKTAKILEFNEDVEVRLKRLHEFATAFIESESSHLFWNYSNHKNVRDERTMLWDNDMKFYVSNDACKTCRDEFGGRNDDVITIADYASIIDGVPYEFRFAIENRRPVLDEIKETNFDPADYDIVALEGATIIMAPLAFDADEDKLIFNYSGWKAEYDEEYKFLGSTIINKEKMYYENPVTENRWHNSEEYIYTQFNATYNTSGKDIGPHNTTLTVLDDEGLFDFQLVRILVNDRPVAVAAGDNYYDDIPNQYASLEDPYELDSAGSRAIFTGPEGVSYIFVDDKESLRGERKEPKFRFPSVPNIETIPNFGFTNEGPHNFRVFVVDNIIHAAGTSMASVPIEVYPCIPHKNPDHPYSYPFHKLKAGGGSEDIDPFQATHVCCLGDIDDPSTWRIAQPEDNIQCGPNSAMICKGTRGNTC